MGKLEVSTTSGEFKKEIELEDGENKIVVNALGATLATASASVAGTLLKPDNYAFLYLMLLILAGIAGFGIVYGVKRMRKGKSETKSPSEPKVSAPADAFGEVK